MIHTSQIGSNIRERLKELPSYFGARGDVAVAYLFGSYEEGRTTSLSDVDIAVLLKIPSEEESYFPMRLEVLHDVCHVLGTDEVDLVILNQCSVTLAYHAIRSRNVIYSEDERARVAFETRVVAQFLDQKFMRKTQQEVQIQQLQEGTYFAQSDDAS